MTTTKKKKRKENEEWGGWYNLSLFFLIFCSKIIIIFKYRFDGKDLRFYEFSTDHQAL